MSGGDRSIIRASWELRPADGGPAVRGELRALQGPPPASAVIIVHGFKGFRRWGFFPYLARQLAQAGHAAITFDLSHNGVGADGVDYSALELFASATHSRNVEEIRMVVEAVASGPLFPHPPERIGLFGHSRGGGEAVIVAAEEPRIDALVTWAAISNVRRWSEEQIASWERGETVTVENARTHQSMPIGPGYWRDVVEHADRLDILRHAGAVAVPWLIVHGEADETVGASEAGALHAAARGAELRLIEGTGHTFGASHPLREIPAPLAGVTNATIEWFARHLRPGAPL